MSIFSTLNKNSNNIKAIIMGAILTGIALVIAQTWSQVIKKTVLLLVNKVRCEKYLIKNDIKEYKICEKSETIETLFLNAIITSIIIYIVVAILFGKRGIEQIRKIKKIKK